MAYGIHQSLTRRLILGFVAFLLPGIAHPGAGPAPKMKPEQLVSLHLDSLGSEEARASRKSITATGTCRLKVLAGPGRVMSGEAALIAQGSAFRSSLRFPVSDYPAEEVSFDGKKTYVGLLNPGQRSLIGQFLYEHDTLLKEGLLGGALSTAWPLLSFRTQKLKLRYSGIRSVYEQEAHELAYQTRRGDYDMSVRLYFESATHRHIATVYRLEIPDAPAMIPTRSTSGADRAADSPRQVPTRFTLEERFGDFRTVDGLTLPFRWIVRLTTEGPAPDAVFAAATRNLSIIEWDATYETVKFNQAVDTRSFILY